MTIPSEQELDRLVNEGILDPPTEVEELDSSVLIDWATWHQYIWWLLLRRSYQHGGAGR